MNHGGLPFEICPNANLYYYALDLGFIARITFYICFFLALVKVSQGRCEGVPRHRLCLSLAAIY